MVFKGSEGARRAKKKGKSSEGEAPRRTVVALVGAGVSLFAFALYLQTLAPTVLPVRLPRMADSGMLQMQVCTLSISHPTGYPTYLMLSHLITYLPFGDCAYRANLASAVYAALAVFAVYLVAFMVSQRVVPAAAGALAFGVGTTFWSQAELAEVYTLNALLVALALASFLLWRERRRDRYVLLSAFLVGLCLTNHMTSALLLPAGLLFLFLVDRRKLLDWRLMLKAAGVFLVALLPYLYLPIRARTAPMVADNPDNLQRFLFVVTGGNLRGQFFAFGSSELPERAALYFGHLLQNFDWPLLVAAYVGLAAMIFWDRALAALTAFLFLGWGFHAIENRIPDVAIYFIPTYLILALWISYGLKLLLEEAENVLSAVTRTPYATRGALLAALSAAMLLLPLPGIPGAYARDDLSHTYGDQRVLNLVARDAAPHATILHRRSSLWYMVLVEHRRRDLTLVDPFQASRHVQFSEVVWPDRHKMDARTSARLYGTWDKTGVKAARIAAKKGPVYVLIGQNMTTEPFRKAGFRVVTVGPPNDHFYQLVPPGGKPYGYAGHERKEKVGESGDVAAGGRG